MTLSNRERIIQAVQLVADGTPLKQAAEKVGWGYQTMRNQLNQEYRESGAGNIVHLAAMYFRLGLIR